MDFVKVKVYTHKPQLSIKIEETERLEDEGGGFGLYGNPEQWQTFCCKKINLQSALDEFKQKQIKECQAEIEKLNKKINQWNKLEISEC